MNNLCNVLFEEIDQKKQESINGGVDWGMLWDGVTDVAVGATETVAAVGLVAAPIPTPIDEVAAMGTAISAGKNLGGGAGKIRNAFR